MAMPRYYFKLVDTTFIAAIGVHDLPDETAARAEAEEIARSLRETRPELVGKHYTVSVTGPDGAGICAVPLDAPE
jgi:hypothetical protein